MAPKNMSSVIKQGIDPSNYYEFIMAIGDGSFGKVWKAQQKNEGQNCGLISAVKVMKIATDEELEELQVEIDILAACHSDTIIQLHDAYFFKGHLWLSLEYCEGGALDDILQELDEPLKEVQVQSIIHHMICALQYLATKFIIHRDMKAGNILLAADGRPKLCDFGVSAHNKNDKQRRTTFIGSPYWMAPEVIRNDWGSFPYNNKCDIWSLGITAIELAEMNPPHSDMHPMRVLFHIVKNKPPVLEESEMWSPLFHDFLATALIMTPDTRPNADELISHEFVRESSNLEPLLELLAHYRAPKQHVEKLVSCVEDSLLLRGNYSVESNYNNDNNEYVFTAEASNEENDLLSSSSSYTEGKASLPAKAEVLLINSEEPQILEKVTTNDENVLEDVQQNVQISFIGTPVNQNAGSSDAPRDTVSVIEVAVPLQKTKKEKPRTSSNYSVDKLDNTGEDAIESVKKSPLRRQLSHMSASNTSKLTRETTRTIRQRSGETKTVTTIKVIDEFEEEMRGLRAQQLREMKSMQKNTKTERIALEKKQNTEWAELVKTESKESAALEKNFSNSLASLDSKHKKEIDRLSSLQLSDLKSFKKKLKMKEAKEWKIWKESKERLSLKKAIEQAKKGGNHALLEKSEQSKQQADNDYKLKQSQSSLAALRDFECKQQEEVEKKDVTAIQLRQRLIKSRFNARIALEEKMLKERQRKRSWHEGQLRSSQKLMMTKRHDLEAEQLNHSCDVRKQRLQRLHEEAIKAFPKHQKQIAKVENDKYDKQRRAEIYKRRSSFKETKSKIPDDKRKEYKLQFEDELKRVLEKMDCDHSNMLKMIEFKDMKDLQNRLVKEMEQLHLIEKQERSDIKTLHAEKELMQQERAVTEMQEANTIILSEIAAFEEKVNDARKVMDEEAEIERQRHEERVRTMWLAFHKYYEKLQENKTWKELQLPNNSRSWREDFNSPSISPAHSNNSLFNAGASPTSPFTLGGIRASFPFSPALSPSVTRHDTGGGTNEFGRPRSRSDAMFLTGARDAALSAARRESLFSSGDQATEGSSPKPRAVTLSEKSSHKKANKTIDSNFFEVPSIKVSKRASFPSSTSETSDVPSFYKRNSTTSEGSIAAFVAAEAAAKAVSSTSAAASRKNSVVTKAGDGRERHSIELRRSAGAVLGFFITNEGDSFFVTKVGANSIASRDGRIFVGDEVIAVNGTTIAGLPLARVTDLMLENKQVINLELLSKVNLHDAVLSEISVPEEEQCHRLVTNTKQEISARSSAEKTADSRIQTDSNSPGDIVNVHLVKRPTEALGFVLKQRNRHGAITFGPIVPGSIADQSNLLLVEDELLAINSTSVECTDILSAQLVLKNAVKADKYLQLLVRRCSSSGKSNNISLESTKRISQEIMKELNGRDSYNASESLIASNSKKSSSDSKQGEYSTATTTPIDKVQCNDSEDTSHEQEESLGFTNLNTESQTRADPNVQMLAEAEIQMEKARLHAEQAAEKRRRILEASIHQKDQRRQEIVNSMHTRSVNDKHLPRMTTSPPPPPPSMNSIKKQLHRSSTVVEKSRHPVIPVSRSKSSTCPPSSIKSFVGHTRDEKSNFRCNEILPSFSKKPGTDSGDDMDGETNV